MAFSIIKKLDFIPRQIQRFLLKILIVFLIWKLSYHLYLRPHNTIDLPLTNITAKATAMVLHTFDKNNTYTTVPVPTTNKDSFYKVTIFKNGRKGLSIADPCNALELMVLFWGFIVCIPTNAKRLLLFSIFGLIVVFALNVIRCMLMFQLNVSDHEWFDFAHHYGFKLVVYFAIFLIWVLYAKKVRVDAA